MLDFLIAPITGFIQGTSYFGIFVLMTLESALIPIPSEITMPFAGFFSTTGTFNFYVVVLIGAIGNLVGSLISYYIGYFLEETVIVSFINKYGKFILVTEHDYNMANRWFTKYGSSVVFFSRLLPAVRTFISLPAGIFRMNIWKFSAYTFVGSLIWSAILTYVGVALGDHWDTLGTYFHKFDIVIAILGVLLVLFYINHKLKIVKLKIF